MTKKVKKEASTDAGIAGYQGNFGAGGYDPEKPKMKMKKENNLMNKAIESYLHDDFESYNDDDHVDDAKPLANNQIHHAEIDENEEVDEVVKKQGDHWFFYDDKTGVELGSYPNRKIAWEKQRQRRALKKAHDQANKHGKPKYDAKKAKKEHFERLKQLVFENVVSYMFEQQPNDEDSVRWENLISGVSKQTLQSDKKLQNIMKDASKKEIEILNRAINVLRNVLNKTKSFKVKDIKATTNETGENSIKFNVDLKDNKQTLGFSVKLQNGRPVIQIPDETSNKLNNMANDESKMLRAELIMIQEKDLDQMNDVVTAFQKRDTYLSKIEKDVDKTVEKMTPVQIVLLKNLLKSYFKGVR